MESSSWRPLQTCDLPFDCLFACSVAWLTPFRAFKWIDRVSPPHLIYDCNWLSNLHIQWCWVPAKNFINCSYLYIWPILLAILEMRFLYMKLCWLIDGLKSLFALLQAFKEFINWLVAFESACWRKVLFNWPSWCACVCEPTWGSSVCSISLW